MRACQAGHHVTFATAAQWVNRLGDATVAAAMIDLLVYHAEVVSLKSDYCRLKNKDLGRVPNDDAA